MATANTSTESTTSLIGRSIKIDMRDDGYFNATKLCKATGKDWYDFTRIQTTKDFIEALERTRTGSPGLPGDPLITSITTGPNNKRGTWVHPQVAIHLAQWLSPDLGLEIQRLVQTRETVVNVDKNTTPAMSALTLRNGKVHVDIRNDGYINATKLCQAAGREWKAYARLDGSQAFLSQLQGSVKIDTDHLVSSITTGQNSERGTWVHPQVAIHLAQWLSPDLGLEIQRLVQTREAKVLNDTTPAMSILTLHNGNVHVNIRDDGYINATKLCQAAGKTWSNYLRNEGVEAFLVNAGKSLQLRRDVLVNSIVSGPNSERGTWVHPQVAIHLAQWLSPELGLEMSRLVQAREMEVMNDSTPAMSILTLQNGKIPVNIRDDGYINATKLCQSAGKVWGTYYQNKTTREYIASLERSIGIPMDLLISSITTGPNSERGTWVHPQVAIHLAQWLSPEFAVAVTDLVLRYSKGEVTTEESQAVAASIAGPKKPDWITDEDQREHHRLLRELGDERGVYVAMIAEDIAKFGNVQRTFNDRVADHKRDFEHFNIFALIPTDNPLALEQYFAKDPLISDNKITFETSNGKTHREIVRLQPPELTQSYIRSVLGRGQKLLCNTSAPIMVTNENDVEIEREKTKREKELTKRDQEATKRDQEATKRDQEMTKREQELTKREQEKTRQMGIQLEIMRLAQHARNITVPS